MVSSIFEMKQFANFSQISLGYGPRLNYGPNEKISFERSLSKLSEDHKTVEID